MKYLTGLSCVLAVVAGCATSDDDDATTADSNVADPTAAAPVDPTVDPAAGPTDPATSATTAPRRALPQPNIDRGGSTVASVTPGLDGATVVIDGGNEPAAYALVTYAMTTGAMSATGELTVTPAPGASFEYLFSGSGNGYSSRQIRLERDPGADTLFAASTSGLVACGALPAGRATTIAITFNGTAKTFDVQLNGARTPCTRLATRVSGPVTGFRFEDLGSQGYGGHVEFTNVGLRY